ALDISGYLFNKLGAVFRQKGVFLGVFVQSSDGPSAIDFSPTGAAGTATRATGWMDAAAGTVCGRLRLNRSNKDMRTLPRGEPGAILA
ncbi:MAG: hypothetical protein ACK4MZ_05875, partial [Thermomonas haemolytica]